MLHCEPYIMRHTVVDYGGRDIGDVSFHSCRTLHAAGSNTADDGSTREAIKIVYIGSGKCVL